MSITLTVCFEDPFWVGYFERREGDRLTVARVVFGAEPTDWQVLAWLQDGYGTLRFSPPVAAARAHQVAANPKRRQRQAAQAQAAGIGTKSQQALQLAREEAKVERKTRSRAEREAEQERRLALHIAKRKEKHRGH